MSALPFISPVLVPFLALAYRCRGGFLSLSGIFSWWGTTSARVFYWAIPVALSVMPISLLWCPACGLLAFLGLMIPHSAFQGSASLKCVIGMAGIGLVRLALILTPLAVFHPTVEVFSVVGLLSGLGYYAGWRWLNGHLFWQINSTSHCALTGSEYGELLTGAAFGLGIAGAWIYISLLSPLSWIEQIVKTVLGWI